MLTHGVRKIHGANRLIIQAASSVMLFFSASSFALLPNTEQKKELWQWICRVDSYEQFKSIYPERYAVKVPGSISSEAADSYEEMNFLYLNTYLGLYLNTWHYILHHGAMFQSNGYLDMEKAARSDAAVRTVRDGQITQLNSIAQQVKPTASGYEPYFNYLKEAPGLFPENILRADYYLRKMEDAGNDATQGTSVILPLFYQYFFKLAVSHDLRPVALNTEETREDINISDNISGLFFLRHPVNRSAKNPMSAVMRKLNLKSLGRKRAGINNLLERLAAPWHKQTPYLQDYLIEISPNANADSAAASDLLWLGVRRNKLYTAVYPGKGLLLAYEVPDEQQTPFITHLFGILATKLAEVNDIGEYIFSVREVFYNSKTTGYIIDPHEYPSPAPVPVPAPTPTPTSSPCGLCWLPRACCCPDVTS